MTTPLAVTFDWYGTLASHLTGAGRGKQFRTYLASQGLKGDPWDRRILYDVFNYYEDAYQPEASAEQKRSFWIEFTRLLFQRFSVRGGGDDSETHADAIQAIFGSGSFALFEEVKPILSNLKARGVRLGIISNWHRGLNHFCRELGVGSYLDVIISSADVGVEKPDPRIFQDALRRLSVSPQHTLHVGDSIHDDYEGASAAGMQAVLVDRLDASSGVVENRILLT